MQQIVVMLHILICISLIVMVLLQQGKGASMGAAFGSGASNTLFGSQGPASFLMKLTGGLAVLFFATSLTLGYLASSASHKNKSLALSPATAVPMVHKAKTAPVKKMIDLAPPVSHSKK